MEIHPEDEGYDRYQKALKARRDYIMSLICLFMLFFLIVFTIWRVT